MLRCFDSRPYNFPARIQMELVFSIAITCVLIAAFGRAFAAYEEQKPPIAIVMDDASDVTWAHAVNSLQALQNELAGDARFLEADVSMGHVTANTFSSAIPVMAHPPDVLSDISLDNWLDLVTSGGQGKGVKLDFKTIEAVKPSLELLKKYVPKINFPLWLNADILPGPINSTTTPVPHDQFLKLCRQHFPNAVLSLGWTTYLHPTFPPETLHYEWHHLRSMADAVHCKDTKRDVQNSQVTFAVRGVFASRSIEQLQWLLGAVPGSTLTVWSSRFDGLEVSDLIRIRNAFSKSHVYYDVPEPVNGSFHASKKNTGRYGPSARQTFANQNWMKLSRGESDNTCASHTYVNNDAIVFGKHLMTAVLLKNTFILSEGQRLQAKGYVTFFDQQEEIPISNKKTDQELTLVLADVSLFSKDESTNTVHVADEDDSDVIWSALNSSRLHVFQHPKMKTPSSSCHMFRLDTAEDKSFQAWSLPCDVMYEGNSFEVDAKVGNQEISSRKRLVLPAGPVMLGFISSGDCHAVVHKLEILGESTAVMSGSVSSFTETLEILIVLVCFLMAGFFLQFRC